MKDRKHVLVKCMRKKLAWNNEVIVETSETKLEIDDDVFTQIAEKLVDADLKGIVDVPVSRELALAFDFSSLRYSFPFISVDDVWVDFGNDWVVFLIKNKFPEYELSLKKVIGA